MTHDANLPNHLDHDVSRDARLRTQADQDGQRCVHAMAPIADQPLGRLVLLGTRGIFFCPPLGAAELRGPAAEQAISETAFSAENAECVHAAIAKAVNAAFPDRSAPPPSPNRMDALVWGLERLRQVKTVIVA